MAEREQRALSDPLDALPHADVLLVLIGARQVELQLLRSFRDETFASGRPSRHHSECYS